MHNIFIRYICQIFNIYNIVFILKARYDQNCVNSAIKLQPTDIFVLINPAVLWLKVMSVLLEGRPLCKQTLSPISKQRNFSWKSRGC